MSDPLLSVVVIIVDGGTVLRRLLDALAAQQDAPPLQVIVPYDASVATETEAVAADYPAVQFLPLGVITPERPIHTQAGQHELYDRRRAAGLGAATGELVAMLEDRGVPRADWARAVVRVHEQPHGVIGGAIDGAADGVVNWAFYVCDFGRYGLPFESGPASWVSDVNVSYKRRILEQTRSLWQDRFQEPVVHWAVLNSGEVLYLSSEIVVAHGRAPVSLRVLLPERFAWGRLFGHIRARHMTLPKRVLFSALGPALPFMLLVRHARTQASKGRLGRYLRAAPAVFILLVAWTSGEVWGYITKRS